MVFIMRAFRVAFMSVAEGEGDIGWTVYRIGGNAVLPSLE
jgi:hypothetical protein